MPKNKVVKRKKYDYIHKLTREWQKILRLQDWNVKVLVVPCPTQKEKDYIAFARTGGAWSLKDITIKIRDPFDLDQEENGIKDIEVTLVHELLHLHAKGFDHLFANPNRNKRPAEYDALETMIECSAIAMVRLKRGKMPV